MTRAHTLRREVARALGHLGLADDPFAPRELVVILALRDDAPVVDVLQRLGVDVTPLRTPPPPRRRFETLAPGAQFVWSGHVWTKATFDQALARVPGRGPRRLLVNAYAQSVAQGAGVANAFAWEATEGPEGLRCVAARFAAHADAPPVAPAPG